MPLGVSRIRAICFDLDGTLSDTDDEWVRGLETVLKPFLLFFPARHLHRLARWLVMSSETPGNWIFALLDRLDLDRPIQWLNQRLRGKQRLIRHRFKLIPGIPVLLHALTHHYSLAIVSSRDEVTTQSFLEQHHLSHFFRVVVTAQTTRHTKPFPDPILWAAAAMEVDPHACLMVGDTPPDIHAAKAAGAQAVGVLCGFGTERELHRAGADLILPSPVHLINLLPPSQHLP
ncbi:HAD family hydrolase [Thermanaerothrix sp. 4228-RoL]|uniref:HAD family hydrolase n=1 Tax=Thermanaerothrix solaris TaxID=3058434 RepID=A0ABU3NR85_9CHLR|nr:HAD family hydrolase [Thermanaerothrix sp. 4228-RoL]MDT8899347.1 HAD family hydrolase [Thermanaerothrix sp. 4228-RoL]